MNEKIKQLLIEKNLTPSKFADEIGVQRPSISHILSGRNKPSLEVIQRILKKYPEISFDWFSEESENQPIAGTQPNHSQTIRGREAQNVGVSDLNKTKSVGRPSPYLNLAELPNQPKPTEERKIEKILVFYSDNTFSEYKPFS